MYCKECGSSVNDDALFCTECGANMRSDEQPMTQPAFVPEQPVPAQPAGTQYQQPIQPQYQQPVQPQYQQQIQPQYQQPVQPQYQQAAGKPAKPKKRHGCLTFLLGFLAAIVLVGMAVYVFIPGLLRPYNLGVATTQSAYDSALKKLGYTKDASPTAGAAESYASIFGQPHPLDTALTSEEITSFLGWNRPPYYAVKKPQFRINADGTIDFSGRVNTDYIFNNILNGKYTREQAIEKVPMLKFLPANINLTCNFTGSVVNNTVKNLSLNKVGLNGIPVPKSLIQSSEVSLFLEEALSGFITRSNEKSKTNYELIEVQNGKLVMKGQFPSSLIRKLVE